LSTAANRVYLIKDIASTNHNVHSASVVYCSAREVVIVLQTYNIVYAMIW